MPRAFTTFTTTLYDEENRDFCDLSSGATKLYSVLATQKDVSACGSLPLTRRRWQRKFREDERGMVEGWLRELVAGRFVLIDDDTEELLIRSFAKHDGGYKHGQRVKAVVAAAEAISSQRLRNAIAVELGKLDVEVAITVVAESEQGPSEVGLVSDSERTTEPVAPDHRATLIPLESGRDVVTYVSTSTSHIPQTTSHVQGTSTRGKRLRSDWVPNPKLIAEMQAEGVPDAVARRELLKFRDHWASQPGQKGVKLDWDATWRNWLRRSCESIPGIRPAVDQFAEAEQRAREAERHDTA